MHWTWGSYVDKNRLYGEYLPVSRFFAGEDLRRTESFSNLEAASQKLLILGLRETDRAYLWVKKRDWGFCQSNAGKSPFVEKGSAVEIPGLKAGDYQAEFYDTKTGKILEKSAITAEGEMLTLRLPGFPGI